MLKSYFLLAWRNIRKHKSSAIINIGGLALGLTTGILVLLFLVDEFSYDNFHKNIDHLYLLMKNQREADGISTGRSSAGPMAGGLRLELPEVTNAARVAGTGTVAHLGDRQIAIDGLYTDTSFFSMMTFPATAGNPSLALRNPNSIILTESAAKKIFGVSNALGKTLIIDDSVPVRVDAVVRDPPINSSIQFEYIRPFAPFESQNSWLKKWDDNRINTWLQLKPGANLEAFSRKATAMLQTRSNDTTVSTFAMPMAQLRLHSGFNNGKQSGGKIYIVALVAILGFFVLIIACINFMNIATARSEVRAREVGVRKVMGASRQQVMMQFFCEALTLTFLSLIAGIVLSHALLPVFNKYMGTNIRFDLFDWRIWGGMISIGLTTAFISGSYPALFLSRFLPAKVLKGEITTGRRRALFRRALVTTQFWVAIVFVIATIVVWQEINYVENRPLGYEQENLLDIHASADLGGAYSIFADQLGKIPAVKTVSVGTDNLLNFGAGITGMDWPGKIPGHEISILVTTVGYNWLRTTGLQLAEGRDFSPLYGTDTSACLINESTIQRLGLKEPVLGQKLGGSTIIGVVKNFVFNNPSGIIAPMAIYLYKGAPANSHFFVRIANDSHWRQTIADIGAVVTKLDPRHGFEYSFTKEDYQRRFEELTSYGTLATIFGGLAVFISCLGLIGLAGFVTERRAKEMSIRKVFGASVQQVMFLLSADFLRPVLIAFLLAVPAAAWAMHLWLDNIAYHIPLHWTVFAMGGILTAIIALTTAGWQGLRTAFQNPADRLRNE
ncbi:MAG TPA: ABC transporter permease [Puia sp.]|jgi:ABC-type antimicrobial peptide transport system permease subunit